MSDLPSSLPGIDVASGLPRVAGNQKLYLKLLRHVAAESDSTKQALATAIAGGDSEAVREAAHSLKGSAANLSITAVTAAAAKLEQAAKDNDADAMAASFKMLETALQAFVSVVAGLEDL